MALPTPSATSTCLVTGASSGIGREIARELAGRGLGVTLVARRGELLEELAGELRSAQGVRVEVIAADLAEEEQRDALAAEVDARGLVVDLLVNNAGFTTMGPVHRGSRRRELAVVRVNVEAVVDLCTRFVPPMTTRRRGAVLNTASTAAFQPLPGQAAYAASKAFVLSYSQALGAELGGTGVTVTALCPGPVETGFGEASGLSDDQAAEALPRIMWVPPGEVARAGIEGVEKGRPVVVPGTANRFTAVAGSLVPRRLLLPLLARRHPAMGAR